MRVAVIVPCYNRPESTERLLAQLAAQTLSAEELEVVVVDDGSDPPLAARLSTYPMPGRLTVLEQPNAGPAGARHRGILATTADVVVLVDDDMQIGRDFLEAHRRAHREGATVVLGWIRPDRRPGMPLFERFHAEMLDRFEREHHGGRLRLNGSQLYTGNVSLRRSEYLAVGGFDLSLRRSEDAELGLRLEQAGARMQFSPAACSTHCSDHTKLAVWMQRSFLYGLDDHRIGRKHPRLANASPWRLFFLASAAARPLLVLATLFPWLAKRIARVGIAISDVVGRLGWERGAIAGATVTYSMLYFSGVRTAAGSVSEVWREYRVYRDLRKGEPTAANAVLGRA
jgi:glycosyltransferase involved in cell wall biosynthesis